MVPDEKTIHDHFVQMDGRHGIPDKEASGKRLYECQRNGMLSPKNSANIEYSVRDSEFLNNEFHKLAEYQNARMFEYMFGFTNRNLTLYDLMGTKHPNANLQENYKKSKCLVDNVDNLTIDLERYICENKCFFDPILIKIVQIPTQVRYLYSMIKHFNLHFLAFGKKLKNTLSFKPALPLIVNYWNKF